jgi:hypothetical protein
MCVLLQWLQVQTPYQIDSCQSIFYGNDPPPGRVHAAATPGEDRRVGLAHRSPPGEAIRVPGRFFLWLFEVSNLEASVVLFAR